MTSLLGVDSGIRHDEFGNGVVISLNATGYTITFQDHGVKILKFDAPLTIIEAIEPEGDRVKYLIEHQQFVGEKINADA